MILQSFQLIDQIIVNFNQGLLLHFFNLFCIRISLGLFVFQVQFSTGQSTAMLVRICFLIIVDLGLCAQRTYRCNCQG